jgi:hypothetical protein
MIDPAILESFERAFSTNTSGCVRECECGRIFYNPNGAWDFEEGEIERYAANPRAKAVDYSVGCIWIDGHEYALDCECWHAKADRIIKWLQNNAVAVAEFLSSEKKRKTLDAERAPVVI